MGGLFMMIPRVAPPSPAPVPPVARVAVRPAGDRYEREADKAADSTHPIPLSQVDRSGGDPVHPAIGRAIAQTRGHGRFLPDTLRHSYEQRLEADLGDVRVHTDAAADGLSRLLRASAFTTGRDIYFRRGAYDPATTTGRRTLAHELAHTVQQSSAEGSAAPVQRLLTHDDIALTDQQLDAVIDAMRLSVKRNPQSVAAGWDQEIRDIHGDTEQRVELQDLLTTNWPVPIDVGAILAGLVSKKRKFDEPLDRAVKPRLSTVSQHLRPEDQERLDQVLGIYGPQATTKVGAAMGLAGFNDVTRYTQRFVTEQSSDPEYRQSLKKTKPALFWQRKDAAPPNPAELGKRAWKDTTGTIGEFLDDVRLRRRVSAKGSSEWIVRHQGGSGETGPDVIIIKHDTSAGTWRIVCHEVKLSLAKEGAQYGYGGAQGSGLPAIYRANYDPTGNRIWPRTSYQGKWLGLKSDTDSPVLELYLAKVIQGDETLPQQVRATVPRLLKEQAKTFKRSQGGQPVNPPVRADDQSIQITLDETVPVRWKYTPFGPSEVANIGVPVSKLSQTMKAADYHGALGKWFEYMDRFPMAPPSQATSPPALSSAPPTSLQKPALPPQPSQVDAMDTDAVMPLPPKLLPTKAQPHPTITATNSPPKKRSLTPVFRSPPQVLPIETEPYPKVPATLSPSTTRLITPTIGPTPKKFPLLSSSSKSQTAPTTAVNIADPAKRQLQAKIAEAMKQLETKKADTVQFAYKLFLNRNHGPAPEEEVLAVLRSAYDKFTGQRDCLESMLDAALKKFPVPKPTSEWDEFLM